MRRNVKKCYRKEETGKNIKRHELDKMENLHKALISMTDAQQSAYQLQPSSNTSWHESFIDLDVSFHLP